MEAACSDKLILETEQESQRLSQQPEPADKQLSPSKGNKEPVYLSAADSHLNLQAVTGSHHQPRNSVSCLPPLTVSWVELLLQLLHLLPVPVKPPAAVFGFQVQRRRFNSFTK